MNSGLASAMASPVARKVQHAAHGPEPQFGGRSDQSQGPFLIVHTGQRHHHAGLGAGNLWLGHTQAVDSVADDLDRLVEHGFVGLAYGDQPDRDAALEV